MLRPPLSSCAPTRAKLASGDRVLVVADESGAAKALGAALEERGLDVLLVDDRPDPRAFETLVREWSSGGKVAGMYFLTALDPEAAWEELDIDGWRARQRGGVHLLCAAVRALYETLDQEGSFLVSGTRMGGLFGYGANAAAASPDAGAITGFVKAMSRERPNATIKAVDFGPDVDADAVARLLLAETERDPGAVEIGYEADQRFSIAVVEPGVARPAHRTSLTLDDQTVFAVTGGAGAVTVEIVRDLASASKGVFHLLDARPMPDEAMQADVRRLADDRDGLKRDIFGRIKAESGRATPAQVEKVLFDLERAGAILDALQAVRDLGGRAFYHSVDVTDAEAVRAAVDEIRDTSGKIDVILHAAGIERSRSLDKKPVEEFDLIFAVKSDGLFNLIHSTRERDDVRALVCFSSVAGRFGNAGQTDYSAGNDLMCKLASAWAAAHPERLAIALDWSAWGGIGMATRGSIPEMMKRAGIEMLDPAEAVPVVRQMLETGFSGEAVIGRRLGMLLDPPAAGDGIDARALAASKPADTPSMALGFDPDAVSFDAHRGLELTVQIDPQREPFLRDHEIDGTPVLPGVMGLEAFAEVAVMLAPDHHVEAIEDVEFRAPMKYFRREPRSMTIHAIPLHAADGRIRLRASLTSTQELVGGETLAKTHFAATVILAPGDGPDAQPTIEPGTTNGSQAIERDAIYEVYFHGPAYQVLSKVGRTEAGRLEGELSAALPAETASPDAKCVFQPRLVELCFQTAGVWEIGATGQLGLPAGVDRVTVWKVPEESSLVAEVFPSPEQTEAEAEAGSRFDAYVRDRHGRVYVAVKGYRTSPMPGALPDERLAPFREVVKA